VKPIDYAGAPYPIREDFAAAHNRYWKSLGAPGSWLTAVQKIAVAREVRQAHQCSLCRRRKEALSPYAVDGAHEAASDLSDVMVEVIHRITTDPGRLTKTWYDGIIRQGLSEEAYVEILGTLVEVFLIDEFCRGIGVPPNELPEPQPGEPSRYRPAKARHDGAWVPMLPDDGASGAESDLWHGRTGRVIRALSLVPDEVRAMLDLLIVHYLDNNRIWDVTSSPKGTLTRIQTEVVAARVSALNGCFY
jgi:alkylhydroperoxidase family enzyme